MAGSFAVFVDGVEVDLLEGLDEDSRRLNAARAINKIARDARKRAADLIRSQINLPARYVSPSQKRLYVSRQATRGTLEARITAQGRATSLAQFVQGSPKIGKAGVYVEVATGKPTFLKKAFVIRLPQGSSSVTDTKFNLGLAVRLRPGESMQNKLQTIRVAKGLYALYGPSVSQIFRANDNTGVAEDIAPEVARKLSDEFLRLMGLD